MTHTFFNIGKKQFLFLLIAFVSIQVACKKDSGGGNPVITHVAAVDSLHRDSFFTQALPGALVHIIGDGFTGTTHIYFNDLEAPFNSALGSNTTLIVSIPANTPTPATNPNVSNQVKVVTNHGTAIYSFTVVPPPPIVASVSNENALPGATITVKGTNFYSITNVVFPGGVNGTNVTASSDGTQLTVTVPTLTKAGPLTVTGKYGSGSTVYPFNSVGAPTVGFQANFEWGDPYFGWQYWGGNNTNTGFPNNTGQFIEVHPSGAINAGDGSWYSDNRAVMVAGGSNWIASASQDSITKYALKFELSINPSVPWTAGSFMIVPSGNFNYMARYAPWETTTSGSFTTNGWVTVTIPLTKFLSGTGSYNAAGNQAPNIAALAGAGYNGTLQIMLFNDGTTTLKAFDGAVDNVRIVKYQ